MTAGDPTLVSGALQVAIFSGVLGVSVSVVTPVPWMRLPPAFLGLELVLMVVIVCFSLGPLPKTFTSALASLVRAIGLTR
ncbi:hypothetical protein EAH83_11050 [Variovorax ginsengisoli]|uniref:Uncharacterized protein n=1 Tax=Variovorax guangxiensis TaxID=1775474 RepID=A0A502DXR7_9BURK|nr:hypothetical protein EAH83_11050 [Variovorax ginsengisoli]TPG29212.1 hypothetical protein EAH82_10710 [Variovorax guangxiensis]